MKKDKNKTQVKFLIHKDSERGQVLPIFKNEVFAYFPNENHDRAGVLKTSYAHIGQHSACSPEYAKESRQATTKEYSSLKNELEQLGYNLEILNK